MTTTNPLENTSPVTIEIGPFDRSSTDYIVSASAELRVVEDGATIIEYSDAIAQTWRAVWFSEVTHTAPGRVEGISTEGNRIVARRTEPDDVVVSRWFDEQIPLPLDVISGVIDGEVHIDLHALVADDGLVRTMLLATDVGMYCRYDGEWIRVTTDEAIGELDAVDVADEALSIYDWADAAGQVVAIASLPVKT